MVKSQHELNASTVSGMELLRMATEGLHEVAGAFAPDVQAYT